MHRTSTDCYGDVGECIGHIATGELIAVVIELQAEADDEAVMATLGVKRLIA